MKSGPFKNSAPWIQSSGVRARAANIRHARKDPPSAFPVAGRVTAADPKSTEKPERRESLGQTQMTDEASES